MCAWWTIVRSLTLFRSTGIVQSHAFVAAVLNFRLAVAFEMHISFPDSLCESVSLVSCMRYNQYIILSLIVREKGEDDESVVNMVPFQSWCFQGPSFWEQLIPMVERCVICLSTVCCRFPKMVISYDDLDVFDKDDTHHATFMSMCHIWTTRVSTNWWSVNSMISGTPVG